MTRKQLTRKQLNVRLSDEQLRFLRKSVFEHNEWGPGQKITQADLVALSIDFLRSHKINFKKASFDEIRSEVLGIARLVRKDIS